MDKDIQPANVSVLTTEITKEILGAFNLPRGEFWQNTVGSLVKGPATRFSEMFAKFDQDCYNHGVTYAARNLVTHFTASVTSVGAEYFPAEGPLLITSNHPGTVDGVSIVANAPRDDIKVVVGGMPFLQKLPVAKHYTIASDKFDNNVRATAVRKSIRHLEQGGALLIFPSGQIDPDPSVLPGAKEALENWSQSIALMLRRVPETKVLPAIASGVLHERFTRTPLTLLKSDGVGKRRIMEFLQVLRQLVLNEKPELKTLVTFDEPFTMADLKLDNLKDREQILKGIVERSKVLLNKHVHILSENIETNYAQLAR